MATACVRLRNLLFQRVKMAGRRAALKAIDWLAFAERVPPNQRGMFNALKTRTDAISAKYAAAVVDLIMTVTDDCDQRL